MIDAHQQEGIQVQNSRSLQALSRTLAMSQGEFSLILARCNYAHLREQIVQQLREQCSVEISELTLPPSTKTLYSSIEAQLAGAEPPAFMVFGLEAVEAIDQLLQTANQVREVFPNNFHFPLVLWVNDNILKKLVRLVPDIESWTTSVEFTLGTSELIDFLRQSADRLFATELEGCAWRLTNTKILGANAYSELALARKDLESQGITLAPTLEASLEFIRGRHEYALDSIDTALQHYQQSLKLWKAETGKLENQEGAIAPPSLLHPSCLLQGVTLFHIGMCYRRRAQLHRINSRADLTEAKNYLQQSLNLFEQAGREDLVAKFINQLGQVLGLLEDWDALWDVAILSRRLHQGLGEGVSLELAQAYSFLAIVAVKQSNWEDAKEWANIALEILDRAPEEGGGGQSLKPQHEGFYRLILAKAEYELGQRSLAIEYLEIAHSHCQPHKDPQLYLWILELLQMLYFEKGSYLEAFKIKQEYRTIEHLYGFRAFIGATKLQPHRQFTNPTMESAAPHATIAGEITASGRLQDVNRLIERLSSTQYKLTVIYGQSGVGKSSIVTAGLVPALTQKVIESREVVPVVLQVYNDWARELQRKLATSVGVGSGQSIVTVAAADSASQTSVVASQEPGGGHLADDCGPLIAQLQSNAEKNRLTVLIFDQFEEFFFVWKEPAKRLIFFELLRNILNIAFVKVILSMREDCLHYLLEFSRPIAHQTTLRNDLMNDILSKEILYYLGNFSPEDARAVIKSLTERSQFYLEAELLDQLVKDLAGNVEEVRPIELQVVGAQLQEEGITTLAEYQKLGTNPKQKLVERLLEEVVKDCGPENESAALRILYSLTDEDDTRPLKTRAELSIDLAAFEEEKKLDLVLEILVKSGLVFRWTEGPTELYQLVHDYLVTFIRQQQDLRDKLDRQAEVTALQKQNKLNQAEIERQKELAQAIEKKRQAEEKLYRNRQRQFQRGIWVAVSVIFVFGCLTWFATYQEKEAEQARKQAEFERERAEKAQIEALESSSKSLVLSTKNDPLGILVASVQLGRESQKSKMAMDTKNQIAERLRQVVSGVQERNSFDKHSKYVLGVSFSPDGNTIASASADSTVILWSKSGTVRRILKHGDSVLGVSFSPDGQVLATASADQTVKLWRVADGSAIATLKGHSATVTSVSWNRDGKTLASSSYDKTVKIWSVSGKLLQTLTGHQDLVLGVSWSPDGNTLASASADKTINLWKRKDSTQEFEARPSKTLQGHTRTVHSVSWSPTGNMLASASADNTVKLWNLEGKELKTLKGHNEEVVSVSFSNDGQILASGSADDTVKIWSRSGALLTTLRGHQDDVRAVSFSRDGTIASGSYDKTVKLWRPDSTPLSKILAGHSDWIYSVSFSPDSSLVASASSDKTVKLWRSDGSLVRTLEGHQDSVGAVSFSPKGDILASGSDDKTVKLWDLDGTLLKTLIGHRGAIYSLSFSPQGSAIATASEDHTVKLWNVDGKELQTLKHEDSVNSVAWSLNGKMIASASEDHTVKLWGFDGKEAALLKTLKHGDSVNSVAWSADGKVIASASNDKTVKLWDSDGQLLETLPHGDRVIGVTFSQNGKLLATAVADNTLEIWGFDGRKATLLKTLQLGTRMISVSFSPDSQTIAWGGRDKAVTLWRVDNLELDNMVLRGCEWLQDYLNYNPLVVSERTLCQGVQVK